MNEKTTPKPYRRPRLLQYGSIRKITRSLSDRTRAPDGIKGKFNKT